MTHTIVLKVNFLIFRKYMIRKDLFLYTQILQNILHSLKVPINHNSKNKYNKLITFLTILYDCVS